MQIHQLMVGAADGDAITRIARLTQERLRRIGHSEMYAHHVDPSMAGIVAPLSHLGEGSPENVLIVRASIGDEALYPLLADRPERIFVAYHNMTPAEFFDGVDPLLADLLRTGREQLVELRPHVQAAWADSRFNAADLTALGYDDVAVVAPAVEPQLPLQLRPDPLFAAEIGIHAPKELVLFVGQILPHKRIDLLIEAVHLLVSHRRPHAALVVVGAPRSPRHAHQLARLAASLALPHVWFTGQVSDERLGELYRRADVFATASSHEGYCVPVLEAMAAGVPVVASDAGALPDTVGGAGILLPDPGPVELAEALDLALERGIHAELVLAGRERVRSIRPELALDELEDFLAAQLELPGE